MGLVVFFKHEMVVFQHRIST